MSGGDELTLADGHDWDMPGSDWQKCRLCGLQANYRQKSDPSFTRMLTMPRAWHYLDFSGRYVDESLEAKPCKTS